MVVWSDFAKRNLHEIYLYIAETSRYYAKIVIKDFFEVVKKLEQFPEMGKVVPEDKINKYREIFLYSYRIIYRQEKRKVFIIAVVNTRRNLLKK